MQAAHLDALKRKHKQLEDRIHKELCHVACNDFDVERLKKQRLHIKEEIFRIEESLH